MKKYLFFLLLGLFVCLPMMAQEKRGISPEKRKEFREYKMKFLAQEMGLKDDTRKKFFELYNELSDERVDIRFEIHDINKKIKENIATDADYATLNRLKEQEAAITKKYDAKFASFLTSKEIFKMKQAEEVFRKKLHEMSAKKHKHK